MSNKIKLIMLVCGPNLMFNIDGTNDKIIFDHRSKETELIEEYLRWTKDTINIVEFPDGGIGTNWNVLDKGSIQLHKELQELLKHTYELELLIPRDDYSNVYKRD